MQPLLDPAILFFVFGVVAATLKSNLEIPPAISRFLSLYLLMALGLKGGFALSKSGFTPEVAASLGVAITLAIIIPLCGYFILKTMLTRFDAAAVAATYGSVSAVTFVTAVQYLDTHGISYGGYMAAAMALMESPAIILAVLLANRLRHKDTLQSELLAGYPTVQAPSPKHVSFRKILHESVTDGPQCATAQGLVLQAGVLCGFCPPLSRLIGVGVGMDDQCLHGGCHFVDGVGSQCLLHRGASGFANRHTRGESVTVFWDVIGHHLPTESADRHPSLQPGRQTFDTLRRPHEPRLQKQKNIFAHQTWQRKNHRPHHGRKTGLSDSTDQCL